MSDKSDPTEEMIRKEISEAVRILREDGVHIHKSYAAWKAKQDAENGTDDKTDEKEEETEGNPPPKKDKEEETPPVKKRGLWWGDATNDDD